MKKIIFVLQSKGGVGKSVLTYLMASKIENERKKGVFFDLDDATKTTIKQLDFLNPKPIPASFLAKDGTIDRSYLMELFEKIAITSEEKNLFIFDLGASLSEQMPFYFKDAPPKELKEILTSSNIELEFHIVIGGGNIFNACIDFASSFLDLVKDNFKVYIAKNLFFAFSSLEEKNIEEFLKTYKISKYDFNITDTISSNVQMKINDVLKSGKNINTFSPYIKIYFNPKYLENIPL